MTSSLPGDLAPEGVLAADAAYAGAAASSTVAPTASAPQRQHRRLDQVRGVETAGGVRIVPGQLPTFERRYLVRELRQIGLISSSLLALIIALTVILR
jgi:hypothetical protein